MLRSGVGALRNLGIIGSFRKGGGPPMSLGGPIGRGMIGLIGCGLIGCGLIGLPIIGLIGIGLRLGLSKLGIMDLPTGDTLAIPRSIAE